MMVKLPEINQDISTHLAFIFVLIFATFVAFFAIYLGERVTDGIPDYTLVKAAGNMKAELEKR